MLERAHSKLSMVATEIRGIAGRAIGAALVEGGTDPATMIEWAKGRMRSKIPLLEQALTGLVREHHRQLLALQLAPLDCLDAQIDTLSVERTRRLTALGVEAPPTPPVEPAGPAESPADLSSAFAPMVFLQAVTLLDTIPGVDQGAELLVAEWGIEMAHCGAASHPVTWSGVAPCHDVSAGKQCSGKTRQGNRALRTGLTQLAHAAARTKGTSLSAVYQRLAARWGKARATLAVAHAIMASAFPMLFRNELYEELGANDFEHHRRAPLVDR